MSELQSNFPASKDQILALLKSRELTTRENTFFSPSPREVYKEKKKEIQKESSRVTSEDVVGSKVSGETCLLASTSSSPQAFVAQEISLESETSSPGKGQEEGNVISPRELTSRWSGISVQHVRTPKGVKAAITLQQPDWCDSGACQMATAELKRYDRMREIKATPEDSPEFINYLETVKNQLQEDKAKTACIGRLHHRGKRSQWLLDTLLVAVFENDQMSQVMLYLEGEEFLISMDHVMSPNQQKFYHCAGIHGQIQSGRQAPRLSDLPLVKFGGI